MRSLTSEPVEGVTDLQKDKRSEGRRSAIKMLPFCLQEEQCQKV